MGKPTWPDGQLTCPLLVDNRCSMYDNRPLICRLWGIIREMPCPFGCAPDRIPSDAEVSAWWDEWRAISGTMVGPNMQHIADKLAISRPLIGILK
jgi:hypothetical protein